jgi:hypothetical protein
MRSRTMVGRLCTYQQVNDHADCVELLLANGADANAKSKRGQTPLDAALQRHVSGEVIKPLRQCVSPAAGTPRAAPNRPPAPSVTAGNNNDSKASGSAQPSGAGKAIARDSKNVPYCSFCDKSEHQVRKLIAGPSDFICDECAKSWPYPSVYGSG